MLILWGGKNPCINTILEGGGGGGHVNSFYDVLDIFGTWWHSGW